MARIHGIVLVTLILGGTALWLLLAQPSGSSAEPISGPQGGRAEPEPPGPLLPGVREEVKGSGTAKQPEVSKPPVPAGGGEAAGPADVVLRVRGIPGNVMLPKYRWTLWAEGQRRTGTADEQGGDTGLRMPKGTPYRVLLEADGYEPQEKNGTIAAEPQVLDVFLATAGKHTGVVVTARDERAQPVPNLRVDLWRLKADAALDQTGAAGEPLWSRRTSNDEGSYQLPELEPGRYELRAMAVDGEGALLPLLPFRARFEVTGSNSVPLQANLLPGAVLTLQPVDPAGSPLRGGPDDNRPPLPAIELRAIGPDGKEHDVDWRGAGSGRAVVERNKLVEGREVTCAEALPPGWWRFTAWVDGAACGAAEVLLVAGQQHKEKLTVLLRR
jgi:hypothetical protein